MSMFATFSYSVFDHLIYKDAMNKAVLIYDSGCGLCQRSRTLIEGRMAPGAIEFLPCQSEERLNRFPQITTENCMNAIQLIDAAGQVYSGAAAIPEILQRLNGWRRLVFLFRTRPLRKCAPVLYNWIARHRLFLSCALPANVKKV
jgi:predicted DCC family thiol-disulfide oxidoreductase YuxK